MATIGIIHPGEMGVSVGAAARANGHRVLWASAGRSAATKARALEAQFEDAETLADLLVQAEVVVSICPPHAALDVAGEVAGCAYQGIYLDANAIAPTTARAVAAPITEAGASFVDGGIIGPPAYKPEMTRLYLSGDKASVVAALFEGTPLEPITLGDALGKASALKMAYAAWTKGTSALLLAVNALAKHEAIEQPLFDEWQRSLPELVGRSKSVTTQTLRKAWRFAGEMREIAQTFEQAGLPAGFHSAAAELYERLETFKDVAKADADAVLERLLEPDAS